MQTSLRPIVGIAALAALAAVVLGRPAAAAPETPRPPNVVFILADDLGWADTTLHGGTSFYETPNVERLAKRGMIFTRAYSASPLCSPTRAAILTGQSPARTGITAPNCHLPAVETRPQPGKQAPPGEPCIMPLSATRLDTSYRTLAEALRDAGYATGHFGKWHLGAPPHSPREHGFDVDLPRWHGPGPAGGYVAPWKFPQFEPTPNAPREHIEDRMAREAVAFMESHSDVPFFVNYWMFSVHSPFDAKPELVAKHARRVDPASQQRSPTYAAMVESMDDAVGTLLDALDRLQIADRTIVVFTSDNGGNMYDVVDGTAPTSNAPLRGGKATLYEGGVRVPCVIVAPGVAPAGATSTEPIQSEDFYPTLLELTGLAPEAGQTFDGTSIAPALRGGHIDREAVFQYFPHAPGVPDWLPPSVSVHAGDWKLIHVFHGIDPHRRLLFDLAADPGETRNLAAGKPDLVAALDAKIAAFLTATGAVVPGPNPAFDPALHRPERIGKPRRPPRK